MAVKHNSESSILRQINEALAIESGLDGVDLRVFLYLSSVLSFVAFSVVQQIELATILGRRKEHVSRSMRKLEARGVIIAGSKVGRSLEWRLNPEYGIEKAS